MRKKTVVISSCFVLGLLAGAVTLGTVWFGRVFGHETFEGDAAISFIQSHPMLARQWAQCGLDEFDGEIVKVVAGRGAMQSGSRFCAVAALRGDAASDLSRYTCEPEGVLKDKVLGLFEEGALYQVASRVADGPAIEALVPRDTPATVIYYAYAGDGS